MATRPDVDDRTASSGALPRIIGTKSDISLLEQEDIHENGSHRSVRSSNRIPNTRVSMTRSKLSVPSIPEATIVDLIQKAPSNPLTNAIGRGPDANGLIVGYWKVGISECYHDLVPNCFMSMVCPCIAMAQVTHRIGLIRFHQSLATYGAMYIPMLLFSLVTCLEYIQYNESVKRNLSAMKQNDALSTEDAIATVLMILESKKEVETTMLIYITLVSIFSLGGSLFVLYVRYNIREVLRIPGNWIEDLGFSLFLPCCVIAQIATQTESYELKTWRFQPRDVLPGYALGSFRIAPSNMPPS